MNTCDELLATEILFFNVLEPLNPPEVAAFLSALVFQVPPYLNSVSDAHCHWDNLLSSNSLEWCPLNVLLCYCFFVQEKNNEDVPLTSRLETARAHALSLSGALVKLQEDNGISMSSAQGGRGEGVASSLNFGLAAPVYEWARGVPFHDITGAKCAVQSHCNLVH
jgi:superfamily II RNA helicase